MQDRLNMLGYADQIVADYYDVPIGTPSEQINLLDYQQKQSKEMLDYKTRKEREDFLWKINNTPVSSNGGSGSSGGSVEKEWTPKDSAGLFKDASDLAKTLSTLNKSGSDTGEMGNMAAKAGIDPNKEEYTEADIEKLYYYLYQLYNTDPSDALLLKDLQEQNVEFEKTTISKWTKILF